MLLRHAPNVRKAEAGAEALRRPERSEGTREDLRRKPGPFVVDANGVAGYQANQDWVFQLENHTGTLTASDFI